MIPGSFQHHRPASIDEALGLLSQFGADARVIAGGHSLIPMMKLRLAAPDHLVDLGAIADLRGIRADGPDIVIGAMTTQAELIESKLLAERAPIIRETSALIADPQVRYWGTLGGNVANGDPGNDMPALMQCLDARYEVKGPSGNRALAAREFYDGAYFTKLEEGEIVLSVRFRVAPPQHGYAYEKLKRKVGDYATAAAAVLLDMKGGKCAAASIALTNVADTALYADAASQSLIGGAVDDAAIENAAKLAAAITDPASDARGPANYKVYVADQMVRRALKRARARALGQTGRA